MKTIHLPETGSAGLRDRLEFELVQSLLDDAAAFRFEYVATGVPERHLGLIWRRNYLDTLVRRLGLDSGDRERTPVLPAPFDRARARVPGGLRRARR